MQEHFPYLNTKFGMSICMNDEAFYLKMLKVYIEDEMSDILQKDYQAEDWVQYEVHVHGMKNVSANIGALELSEHFKGLEYAIKGKDIPDTDYIRNYHDMVMNKYKKLLDGLKRDLELNK